MNRLLKILRMTQEQLKFNLFCELIKKGYKPEYEDGYLYAKGDIPVLLVAHMDIVGGTPPKVIHYWEPSQVLYSPEGKTVLGGDDRCGVYAILELLEKYKPYVLFTEDEEIGGIGADLAARNIEKPDVKYMIEIDRRGENDCVFYDCGNEEFQKYVEGFGFKTATGSFSDISILGSKWDIAAVNLSSGYYSEHTEDEWISLPELRATIRKADKMLRCIDKAKYFDYQDNSVYNDDFDLYSFFNYDAYKDIFKIFNLKPKKDKRKGDEE